MMNTAPIVYDGEQAETYVDLLTQQILEIQHNIVTNAGFSVDSVCTEYSQTLYGRVYTVVANHFTPIFGQEPQERYENIFVQMSSFAEKLAKDHIFTDGNKRTTVIIVLSILSTQGIVVRGVDTSVAETNELYQWVQCVVTGSHTVSELSEFLQTHARNDW